MTRLPEPYFRDPSDSDGPERLTVVALVWSSSVYNPLGHQNTLLAATVAEPGSLTPGSRMKQASMRSLLS